jgi:putative DNA primase/helicase
VNPRTPPPPKTYQSDLANLPKALTLLTQQPRWVLWRWELRKAKDGTLKWTKPPLQPSGAYASSNDPRTWSAYTRVLAAIDAINADGIGYMLLDDKLHLAANDLDDCRNASTGTVAPWAQAYLDRANGAYVEISPSGTGFRIIGTSTKPAVHSKLEITGGGERAAIEVYCNITTGRYITITGAEIGNCPELTNIDPLIDHIVAQHEEKKKEDRRPKNSTDRSATFQSQVWKLAAKGMSAAEIEQHLRTDPLGIAAKYLRPTDRLQAEVERSYGKWKSRSNSTELVSEHTVALEFAEQHHGKLLYDHHRGVWFQWAGTHWRVEETALAFDWAREIAARLAADGDEKARRAAGRHSFCSGVEKFARADRAFAVTSAIWDHDPFLLATPAGTVDLRTGLLRAADPADRIAKLAAVGPAETADCPRWIKFLEESTGQDPHLMRFLQQWFGYCLTGDIREHALVFTCGPGKNGKTTMLNTVSGIMADYAATAAMDAFTASPYDRHTTDLAMLRGARLVTAAETEEGRTWAEARIKQLTGGDPITARFMRQDNFTYMPQFKLTIIGNHTPNLHNVDEATRRRFNIVPFTRTPAAVDKALGDKLRAEWPGILRWMINGCLDWQANELTPAPAVAAATAEYFAEQDLIGQWIEEKCDAEPGNNDKTELATPLFKSYSQLMKDAGEKPRTQASFGRELRKRGFIKGRQGGTGKILWKELRLRYAGKNFDDD